MNMLSAGFDEGSPDGNDPLLLARNMASRGITLVGSVMAHSSVHIIVDISHCSVLCCMRACIERLLGESKFHAQEFKLGAHLTSYHPI